mgnify:CR=1 FL=1|tara:strand:- start:409 stop:642 length:234 start_codon:yes stop_codon:yes gene_type:complete
MSWENTIRKTDSHRLEHESYLPYGYDTAGMFTWEEFSRWLIKMDVKPQEFFMKIDDDYEREELKKAWEKLWLEKQGD